MEPDDLFGAGEIGASGGGADELRAIVARAGRRRFRVLAAGVAGALLAGGGIGYAASNHGGGTPTVIASSDSGGNGASAPDAFGANGASSGVSGIGGSIASPVTPETFTHLFNRTVGTVTIRGYLIDYRIPKGMEMPSCVGFFGPHLQAEVSTDKMVATVGSFFGYSSSTSGAIESGMASIAGVAESDPTNVVVVETSSAVAKVMMQFANGATDEMTPMRGWSVLVSHTSAPTTKTQLQKLGTLKALGSSGQVLQSEDVYPGLVVTPRAPGVGCGGVMCPLTRPAAVSPGVSTLCAACLKVVPPVSQGSGTASSGVVLPGVPTQGGVRSGSTSLNKLPVQTCVSPSATVPLGVPGAPATSPPNQPQPGSGATSG